MKKKFLLNPEYTKYCHTVERYSDDLCVELIKMNRTVSKIHIVLRMITMKKL